ncbi:hypothetical protein [Variovorax sp. YR216]|uniref:hypothetical protein n=1 Tax=Variovorax sp. YR216 TaxID=1882828 RepID=UPI0015A0F57D
MQGFRGPQLALTEDYKLPEAVLPPDQALPVALMTTKMIINAIKHGVAAPVRVAIGMGAQHCGYVAVTNRVSSAATMDWKSGQGLGIGLSLLSTLSEGIAEVTQRSTQQEMIMTIFLRPMGPGGSS